MKGEAMTKRIRKARSSRKKMRRKRVHLESNVMHFPAKQARIVKGEKGNRCIEFAPGVLFYPDDPRALNEIAGTD